MVAHGLKPGERDPAEDLSFPASPITPEQYDAQVAAALWNCFDEEFGAFAEEHSVL